MHSNKNSGIRQTGVVVLLLAAASAGLSGCATPKVAQTGFLRSYDGLQSLDETGMVSASTASAEILARYASIIIEEPSLAEGPLKPQQAEAIKTALSDAVNVSLARDRSIVSEPAEATLRVRYVVAKAGTSNVALNVVATPLLLLPVDYGSLALEVEVTDSVSGERIAAMTWARGAKARNIVGAYSSTGNARALAPEFADRLALLISKDAPR